MKLIQEWVWCFWNYLYSFFNQRQLNIAVVGLQNSGKTSLGNLLTGHKFVADTIPTLGIDIKRATVGQTLIQVYDLAGQTRHKFLWNRCFDKVDLIIYMMDLSDATNWDTAKQTLHEVLVTTSYDQVPVLILGNKIDLADSPPLASQDDMALGIPVPSQQSRRSISLSSNSRTLNQSPYHWKFMTPLLSHYDYDDIPKYQIDATNQYLLKNIQIFSKEIGLDLRNGILHMNDDSVLAMDRDIGIFAISCKDGNCVDDVIDWILQL